MDRTKIERYLSNLQPEAIVQIVKILLQDGDEGRDYVIRQIEEFDKMYSF